MYFLDQMSNAHKIGVWCAISCSRVIRTLFFDTTVSGKIYHNLIQEFIALLDVNER